MLQNGQIFTMSVSEFLKIQFFVLKAPSWLITANHDTIKKEYPQDCLYMEI